MSEEWRPAHCWCNSKNECACHMLPYPYRLSLALAAAGTVRSGIHLKMRPKQVERHQANEYDTMKCSPLAEIPEVVWLRWLPRSSPKRALSIALSQNIDVYTMGQMPMAIVNCNCKNLGAASPFSRELRNRSRRSQRAEPLSPESCAIAAVEAKELSWALAGPGCRVFINTITLGMSDEESNGDQEASSSNDDSRSMDDCEFIEDKSSDEEIEESPSQSAVPSSRSETTTQQDPSSVL